jgi:Cytochrome c7 and related cytochrome c/Class III cytochrome C family
MKVRFGIQVLVAVVVVTIVAYFGWMIADSIIYKQRAQPIAFPHSKHAGNRNIACQYCHRGTEHANIPGVPSVQECMECHSNMPEVAKRPEVAKLKEQYWDKKEPIKWFRVHQVAKHVHFPHQTHIAKGIECTECHGNVKEMDVMKPAFSTKNPLGSSPATMGWCIQCHRKEGNHGPIACNSCHY